MDEGIRHLDQYQLHPAFYETYAFNKIYGWGTKQLPKDMVYAGWGWLAQVAVGCNGLLPDAHFQPGLEGF